MLMRDTLLKLYQKRERRDFLRIFSLPVFFPEINFKRLVNYLTITIKTAREENYHTFCLDYNSRRVDFHAKQIFKKN